MMGESDLGVSHDSLVWSHDISGSYRRELASGSFSGSVEGTGGMSDDLRGRLKRIAKEVTSREGGHKDRRPPPVSHTHSQTHFTLSPISRMNRLLTVLTTSYCTTTTPGSQSNL